MQVFYTWPQYLQQQHPDLLDYITDVTTAVLFNIDPRPSETDSKLGLRLSGNRRTLQGFVNPIPKFLEELPCLCIVYQVDQAEEVVVKWADEGEALEITFN